MENGKLDERVVLCFLGYEGKMKEMILTEILSSGHTSFVPHQNGKKFHSPISPSIYLEIMHNICLHR